MWGSLFGTNAKSKDTFGGLSDDGQRRDTTAGGDNRSSAASTNPPMPVAGPPPTGYMHAPATISSSHATKGSPLVKKEVVPSSWVPEPPKFHIFQPTAETSQESSTETSAASSLLPPRATSEGSSEIRSQQPHYDGIQQPILDENVNSPDDSAAFGDGDGSDVRPSEDHASSLTVDTQVVSPKPCENKQWVDQPDTPASFETAGGSYMSEQSEGFGTPKEDFTPRNDQQSDQVMPHYESDDFEHVESSNEEMDETEGDHWEEEETEEEEAYPPPDEVEEDGEDHAPMEMLAEEVPLPVFNFPTRSFPNPDHRAHSPPIVEDVYEGEEDVGELESPRMSEDAADALIVTIHNDGRKSYLPPMPLDPPTSASKRDLTHVDERFLSPNRADRFGFLNQKPNTIPRLELGEVKRRHEFRTHMYELDCKMGALSAKLANESMDKDEALLDFFPERVDAPLQTIMDNVVPKLSLEESRDGIRKLERRLEKVQTKLIQHRHVTLYDAKRTHFDEIDQQITHDLQPSMRMEANKADKREGSLLRRFDAMAGTTERRYQEERAARTAALTILKEEVQGQEMNAQRATQFIEAIQNIREEISKEREERERKDEELTQEIRMREIALKRALLEAAGNDD